MIPNIIKYRSFCVFNSVYDITQTHTAVWRYTQTHTWCIKKKKTFSGEEKYIYFLFCVVYSFFYVLHKKRWRRKIGRISYDCICFVKVLRTYKGAQQKEWEKDRERENQRILFLFGILIHIVGIIYTIRVYFLTLNFQLFTYEMIIKKKEEKKNEWNVSTLPKLNLLHMIWWSEVVKCMRNISLLYKWNSHIIISMAMHSSLIKLQLSTLTITQVPNCTDKINDDVFEILLLFVHFSIYFFFVFVFLRYFLLSLFVLCILCAPKYKNGNCWKCCWL